MLAGAFYFFVTVFVTVSTVSAQPAPNANHAAIGLEGGLALATLSAYRTPDVNAAFDTGVRRGVVAGAFVEVPLGERLSLRPGVYFVQKGGHIKFGNGGGADSATVDLRYVDVAVLLRLSATGGTTRPFLHVGPTVGFKTSATVDASASGGSSNTDIESQVRRADVAVAVGGGIQRHHWSVEVRLAQGVIDIGNTRSVSDVIRTRTLAILAGIRF